MSIKKFALGTAAIAMTLGTLGTAANASVIDRPFFKVLGTVVVWSSTEDGAGGYNSKVVHDFILNTAVGEGDVDLISADGYAVVTGGLLPLDRDTVAAAGAAGSLDAGVIPDVTDSIDDVAGAYKSSFYVASNTVFNIKAAASNFNATDAFAELDDNDSTLANNITLVVDALDSTKGSAAQLPFDANNDDPFGVFDKNEASKATLADLAGGVEVFQGTQRTAASAGSIEDQSVRFDMTYTMVDDAGETYDMSMGSGTLEAEVTYTVYVP